MGTFTHAGLSFDYDQWGNPDSPRGTVILLHGFPQSREVWDHIGPRLASEGFAVAAMRQRGYSDRARPLNPLRYTSKPLLSDVIAFMDHLGSEQAHVVGHDWGGVIGWLMGIRHGNRVASLSILSTPHPRAALQKGFTAGQALRLWYFPVLIVPFAMGAALRVTNGTFGVWLLGRFGLPAAIAKGYVQKLLEPRALTGALNWYRGGLLDARSFLESGHVHCPTLYVWGSNDVTVTRGAARATAGFVDGDYRFEVLDGASHWLPELCAEQVSSLVLAHLASAAKTTG